MTSAMSGQIPVAILASLGSIQSNPIQSNVVSKTRCVLLVKCGELIRRS